MKIRFRLRHLLVFVLVASVGFLVLSKQLRVAKQLRAEGAVLKYRYQYDRWDDVDRYTENFDAEQPLLVRVFGPEAAATIVKVRSTGTADPSRVAKLCSQLPKLRSVAIKDCDLTDDDLRNFVGLKKLRGLYLNDTAITDDAVATLRQMRYLKVLNLGGTELSTAAVNELKKSLPDTRVWSKEQSGGFM